MGASTSYEFDLPRDRRAPGVARSLLGEQFGAKLDSSELETAKLLTSELVSNAVLHGKGAITLRVELDEHILLVAVTDQGHGLDQTLQSRDFKQRGGWGLHIVESESSRWGVHEGTAHVWFELERTRRLPDPTRPRLDAHRAS